MISSGTTAIDTSSDTAVTLLAATAGTIFKQVTIINESAIVGFFSLDGGTTWARWPTGAKSLTLDETVINKAVQFKRVASGTDVTGLWAFAV